MARVVLLTLILLPAIGLSKPITIDSTDFHFSKVLAIGLGVETGIMGIKYSVWSRNSSYMYGVGLGFEGVIPQVQYRVSEYRNFVFYTSGFVWYNPWGFLLTSSGSIVLGAGVGIQRWANRETGGGIYLSSGVSAIYQIFGLHEGGSENFLGIAPNFQVGISW